MISPYLSVGALYFFRLIRTVAGLRVDFARRTRLVELGEGGDVAIAGRLDSRWIVTCVGRIRRLLTNLQLFYPSPVRLDTLYRTVCYDPIYCKALFQKDIMYFHQKGYIEFIDDVLGGADSFEHKVCLLTSKGKEVAEGTRTDEALEI